MYTPFILYLENENYVSSVTQTFGHIEIISFDLVINDSFLFYSHTHIYTSTNIRNLNNLSVHDNLKNTWLKKSRVNSSHKIISHHVKVNRVRFFIFDQNVGRLCRHKMKCQPLHAVTKQLE